MGRPQAAPYRQNARDRAYGTTAGDTARVGVTCRHPSARRTPATAVRVPVPQGRLAFHQGGATAGTAGHPYSGIVPGVPLRWPRQSRQLVEPLTMAQGDEHIEGLDHDL